MYFLPNKTHHSPNKPLSPLSVNHRVTARWRTPVTVQVIWLLEGAIFIGIVQVVEIAMWVRAWLGVFPFQSRIGGGAHPIKTDQTQQSIQKQISVKVLCQ